MGKPGCEFTVSLVTVHTINSMTSYLLKQILKKTPLGRPRHRWEDNIKMDLQEMGMGAWTGFIWLRTWTGGRLL